MLKPTNKILQPTNVKSLDLQIFASVRKKIAMWAGKILSYINRFGTQQEYSDTLTDGINQIINLKDNTTKVFTKAIDTTYLALDNEVLISNAPIQIVASSVDTPILNLERSGDISINYINNGVPTTTTEANFYADDGTLVSAFGKITDISVMGKRVKCYHSSLTELSVSESDGYHATEYVEIIGNQSLEFIICGNLKKLISIRLFANSRLDLLLIYDCTLTSIEIEDNDSLRWLDLHGTSIITLNTSRQRNLEYLNISKCNKLQKLDISGNDKLISLVTSDYDSLREIRMHANNYQVCGGVAELMAGTNLKPGVLYIGRLDKYREYIEQEAQKALWTVEYL